jgi:diguanylate cyclase (GGDEF)-like protein
MGKASTNDLDVFRDSDWKRRRWSIAILLLLVVSFLFYIQWLGRVLRTDIQVGVYLNADSRGVLLEDIFPGLPAQRAGLQAGDRILAINGAPIHKYEDYDIAAGHFARGKAAEFQLQRKEALLTLTVFPGGQFPWVTFLLNIATAACYLAIGLLAFFQPGRDIRKRLLFLFAVSIACEMALPSEFLGNLTLEIVFMLAFYLLSGFQFAVDLHLVSSIPERHPWVSRHSWIVRTYYVVAIGISAVLAFAYLAGALDWQWFPWPSLSASFVLDNVLLPVWVIAVLGLLGTQAVRYPEPLGRHQAGLVLLGVLPWMAMVTATAVFQLSAFMSQAAIDAMWAIALLPFPVAVFIAMFRYQLLDIQLVVRKGLIFSAMTGTLLVIFYAVLGAGSYLLSEAVLGTVHSALLVAGVALILGLIFPPLRQHFQRQIDRRFFPERLAFRQRLIALAGELPSLGKVPRMGQHLVDQLKSIFQLRSAMLLLVDTSTGYLHPLASTLGRRGADSTGEPLLEWKDLGVRVILRNRKPMSTERLLPTRSNLAKYLLLFDVEWVVPMFVQDKLSGLLFVGRKAEGGTFRAEEIELLDFLAQHVAVVFENAKLYESATYDSLTGILRRDSIFEKLDQELRRAIRYDRPLAVGMADLDHFKEVNDRYGHLIGDITLKRVAQVLTETLRGADLVGRYGGEEFLLVFPETDPRNALEVAERIRRLVAGLECQSADGQTFHVSISIGLATLPAGEFEEGALRTQLIDNADRALMAAKRQGRNNVQLDFTDLPATC